MFALRADRAPGAARGIAVLGAAAGVAIAVVAATLAGATAHGAAIEITRPAPNDSELSLPGSDRPGIAAVQDTVSFSANVLPIFEQRCAKCHGAVDDSGEVRAEASLNLLNYDRVMAGSEFGTVIEAGSAENSYLLEMIVEGDMPEEGDPVPADEIAVIRAWIEAGAPNN